MKKNLNQVLIITGSNPTVLIPSALMSALGLNSIVVTVLLSAVGFILLIISLPKAGYSGLAAFRYLIPIYSIIFAIRVTKRLVDPNKNWNSERNLSF